METKTKNSFKAVEFMRQVRNDLSGLYHTDKERYHNELKKSINGELPSRTEKASRQHCQNTDRTNKHEL